MISTDWAVDDAGGNWYVTYKLPSSSEGIKPVGLDLKRKIAPMQTQISRITIYRAPFMLRRTPSVYFAVTLSNHSLNLVNHLVSPLFFWLSSVGFSSIVLNAGVSESAIKAEIITEIAMVIANCWYSLPT